MELSTNSAYYSAKYRTNGEIMAKAVQFTILAIVVSCYFFPFELTFLPKGLNTKIILAMLGIVLLGEHTLKSGFIQLEKSIFPAIFLAILFSLIGFISVEFNNSADYTYANYYISFGTWMCASYCVCRLLKTMHSSVSFAIVTNYLVVVCVAQCVLALYIDASPGFKLIIDHYIGQETIANVEFLNEVKRIYGIGAALDVAGTRFSLVLVCLVGVMLQGIKQGGRAWLVLLYWSAFMIIAIVGNIMSRTTTVGVSFALVYLVFGSRLLQLEIDTPTLRMWRIITFVSAGLISVAVFLYQFDENFREQLRFGFEGFFNYAEKGEWTTSSTERLNSKMWIWPDVTDLNTWLIGKATFGDWHAVGTDIGYCRFIFYSGASGLLIFCLFFINNAAMCIRKLPSQASTIFLLLIIGFVVWLKVATDTFLIYALMYTLDSEERGDDESSL